MDQREFSSVSAVTAVLVVVEGANEGTRTVQSAGRDERTDDDALASTSHSELRIGRRSAVFALTVSRPPKSEEQTVCAPHALHPLILSHPGSRTSSRRDDGCGLRPQTQARDEERMH